MCKVQGVRGDESDSGDSLPEDGVSWTGTPNGFAVDENESEPFWPESGSFHASGSIAAEEDDVPLLIGLDWAAQGSGKESGHICMPVYTILQNGRVRIDEAPFSTSSDTVGMQSASIKALTYELFLSVRSLCNLCMWVQTRHLISRQIRYDCAMILKHSPLLTLDH